MCMCMCMCMCVHACTCMSTYNTFPQLLINDSTHGSSSSMCLKTSPPERCSFTAIVRAVIITIVLIVSLILVLMTTLLLVTISIIVVMITTIVIATVVIVAVALNDDVEASPWPVDRLRRGVLMLNLSWLFMFRYFCRPPAAFLDVVCVLIVYASICDSPF